MEREEGPSPDPASSTEDTLSTAEIEHDPSLDPAKSIEAILPIIEIEQKHCDVDSQCPVCTDKFEMGCKVRQLSCNHLFHSDCIIPWLVRRSTCPVCRLELPLLSGGNKSSEDDSDSTYRGSIPVAVEDNAHHIMWPLDSY